MINFRSIAFLALSILLFCNVTYAALCSDCCIIDGEPDGHYIIGSFYFSYKDSGGLRQIQRLTNSGGGCTGYVRAVYVVGHG